MTDIEKLREAAALLREECKTHNMCSNCPLYHTVCHHYSTNYPAHWRAEEIGVEDHDR